MAFFVVSVYCVDDFLESWPGGFPEEADGFDVVGIVFCAVQANENTGQV